MNRTSRFRVPAHMRWTGHYDAGGKPIFVDTRKSRATNAGPPGPTGPSGPQNNPRGIQGSHPAPLQDPTQPHPQVTPASSALTGLRLAQAAEAHKAGNAGPVGPRGPMGSPLGPPAGMNHTTAEAGTTPPSVSALEGLLNHANTEQLIDPSMANMVAAPDYAAAKAAQSELSQLPSAKAAALKAVMGWYGDVGHSESVAAHRNSAMAQAGARSMGQAAKGIMASLGGSANAASGQIGAMGANNANTLRAIGANDKSLASDLGPIFKLAQADAGRKTTQQFDEGRITLQNSLAAAQGQAQADKAKALMDIMAANNSARDHNFSNKASLFGTIAGILSKNGPTAGLSSGSYRQSEFVNKIAQGLLDPNNPGKLQSWVTPALALQRAQAMVASAGMNPMDPTVMQTVIAPALSIAGIPGYGH